MNQPTENSPDAAPAAPARAMGFWRCWSMTVGVMIGSGVFLLPAVLAPYGSLSFFGWLLTSAGAILIALVLGRLAGRTERAGGPYAYAHDAFGDLVGFIVAWGYWLGVVFATTAIAVAFAGYAGAVFPALGASRLAQALTASAIIWVLTGVNVKGVAEASSAQLLMVIFKLAPLAVIILLGVFAGSADNIPPFNPEGKPIGGALAATALLTMWAFAGLEAGVVPAEDVVDPKRTMPRAVVAGTLTVAFVYIASTAAVMMLVPVERLAVSTAPFADAAAALGPLGGPLIAFGALMATAGALNGNILLSGQTPMAAALDGIAPKMFGQRNKGHAPALALVLSSVLSTILLVFNYTEGLVAAFTFLISMSVLGTLVAYVVAALAEVKFSWRSARAWAAVGVFALGYSVIAVVGSGPDVIVWGWVLLAAGLPVFYGTKYGRSRRGGGGGNAS